MIRRAGAALAACLVAGVLAGPRPAPAQVSPGELSRAHRELDRPAACFQCHAKRAGAAVDAQCLSCHQEVGWMIAQRRGYHARVARTPCAKCHPEHGGRSFDLIAWKTGTPQRFDHREAGWLLEGKHAELECRTCHQPKLQRSHAVSLMPRGDPARRWMGLERECASCHSDPHRGALGVRCASCHDARAWAPAPRFDHAKTSYPLTGAHAEVACRACHATPQVSSQRDAQGQLVPRWKPLPHQQCSSCHRDPHAGRFGAACARCHSTRDFRTIDQGRFDHDRTRYPLRGRHAALACASCHDPKTAWGRKPRFETCGQCHADAHAGSATIAGKAADCASCHTVEGWRPSNFLLSAHQMSRYPLTGRHARTDCALCHPKQPASPATAALGSARVVMRPAHAQCVDCHLEPHRGRFRPGGPRARAEDCLACHDFESFTPSRFDVTAHARGAFPLAGAHRAVPCQGCHTELGGPRRASIPARATGPHPPLTFELAKRSCADCHAGPHGDQFAQRSDRGACDSCHGPDAWAPASKFDHARHAAFRLDGAHARVPCASCHPRERDPAGRGRVLYRPTPSTCASCHGETAPSRGSALGVGDARLPMARAMPTSGEVRHGARR